MDLPFYDAQWPEQRALGDLDIKCVADLLAHVDPDIVFAAGDLSDPHGTHRLCLDALTQTLPDFLKTRKAPVDVWLYRGAWQEWAPEQIGMVVPLSPDELRKKTLCYLSA